MGKFKITSLLNAMLLLVTGSWASQNNVRQDYDDTRTCNVLLVEQVSLQAVTPIVIENDFATEQTYSVKKIEIGQAESPTIFKIKHWGWSKVRIRQERDYGLVNVFIPKTNSPPNAALKNLAHRTFAGTKASRRC